MSGTGKGPTPRQRELGQRIRARRAVLGLTQEQLSQRSGFHRTYIATFETGLRNMSLDNLCRLANSLEMRLEELVGGLEGHQGRL